MQINRSKSVPYPKVLGCVGTGAFDALAAEDLLSNHNAVDLPTFDFLTTLVLEPFQPPYTNIDHEAAPRKLVDRLAIISAWSATARARDKQLCANKAGTGDLARGQLDLRDHLALRRYSQNASAIVQRSPHVSLLVDAVTIWDCVLAVLAVLGHCEEGAPVRDGAGLGVVVELVDDLVGAVGEEHGVVFLVPCCAVGDADVAERAVERAVGVETEDRTCRHISSDLWTCDNSCVPSDLISSTSGSNMKPAQKRPCESTAPSLPRNFSCLFALISSSDQTF